MRIVNILLEFSAPLLLGVVAALVAANVAPDWYLEAAHWHPFGPLSFLGNDVSLHWIVNDIFMVFFFGIAAKEITESCLPGGSLNPPRKAINPLLATIGGLLGPVAVFFGGLWLFFQTGIYTDADSWSALSRGWGVPTATDIALAWLVARTVFGPGHPAIGFLLLLAVADDAIGLVIIAVFYGEVGHPTEPVFLGLVLLGMALAYGMRRFGVQSWWPYVFGAGTFSWFGMILAHLHPALALVAIVPFLPGPQRDTGEIFRDEDEVDVLGDALAQDLEVSHAPLHLFEHQTKTFVDVGLFFFAFTNAGVTFEEIGPMTWLIVGALVVGKTVCVTLMGILGILLGFPLPNRMTISDLAFAGFIAALGLTVALFVATAAFPDPVLQGQAKMGALLSGIVGVVAVVLGRLFGIGSAADAGETISESQ